MSIVSKLFRAMSLVDTSSLVLPPAGLRGVMATTLLLGVFASGCSDPTQPLVIGTKGFVEQKIVAEIIRQELLRTGEPSATVVGCGDTFSCHAALRAGTIDLLVDYTGTAALFAGIDPQSEGSRERLEAAWKRQGCEVVADLGFDNGYRIAVNEKRAAVSGLSRLSDVDTELSAVRVATPKTFLRRPGDGLSPLLARYGIKRSGEPIVEDSAQLRIAHLLDGSADLAVVYSTDGALVDAPVRLLDDDDGFFPQYDAVVLARRAALAQHAGVRDVLVKLHQQISAEQMRRMNRRATLSGFSPTSVATEFWSKRSAGTGASAAQSETSADLAVKVAVKAGTLTSAERTVTARALRTAFAPRPVEFVVDKSPTAALARGRANVAVLDAAAFFTVNRKGIAVRRPTVAAAAVVGTRFIHAVVRAEDKSRTAPFGRVGVPMAEAVGRTEIDAINRASDTKAELAATPQDLLRALLDGKIDCALMPLALGDAQLTAAMVDGGLALVELGPVEFSPAPPALRRARIPAGTYPNQGGARQSFRTQILIASTTTNHLDSALKGGPAAALANTARPLSSSEVEAIATNTGAYEAPDPALPSARAATPIAVKSSVTSLVDTVLNALAILFLFFTGWLVLRREELFA